MNLPTYTALLAANAASSNVGSHAALTQEAAQLILAGIAVSALVGIGVGIYAKVRGSDAPVILGFFSFASAAIAFFVLLMIAYLVIVALGVER